jgi:iron complex transport system ATP-binding protein
MSSSTLAIDVRAVQVRLGGRVVLNIEELGFKAGAWTCIVGPNGAGKSTLLKALAGLLDYEGQIKYPMLEEGAQTGSQSDVFVQSERARHIAWLGQSEIASQDLNVYDVVMLGRVPHLGLLKSPSSVDHAVVQSALEATQSWDKRSLYVGQLSAGESQRVLIARALAVDADIVLMDEPLTHLDPNHQADMVALIKGLVKSGKTVISVMHEIQIALMADEMLIMSGGQKRSMGGVETDGVIEALEQVFEHRLRVVSSSGIWLTVPRIEV